MKCYSTSNRTIRIPFGEAAMRGLAPDKGLYMPVELPLLPEKFIADLPQLTREEICQALARHLLAGDIPQPQLDALTAEAINFELPVQMLNDNTGILELWHGPTMAFKDVGARFMARVMSYYVQQGNRELTVIAATSGDTGGAVAHGFHNVHGIRVVILYPKGRVSAIQERQFTTLGDNITALAVKGSFDDCQRLVKLALADEGVRAKLWLTSANSINLARLLPQSFYYFVAYGQVRREFMHNGPSSRPRPLVFSVPSGNFGDLTAGVIAKRLGLPIYQFVAATNSNDVVPEYLRTGLFTARPSVATLSNAMDVGDPSNFARLLDLYHHSVAAMRQDVFGTATSEEQTKQTVVELWEAGYLADPHTAVAYHGLQQYRSQGGDHIYGVLLSTAHAAKFGERVEPIIGTKITLPPQLAASMTKPVLAETISTNYADLQNRLLL